MPVTVLGGTATVVAGAGMTGARIGVGIAAGAVAVSMGGTGGTVGTGIGIGIGVGIVRGRARRRSRGRAAAVARRARGAAARTRSRTRRRRRKGARSCSRSLQRSLSATEPASDRVCVRVHRLDSHASVVNVKDGGHDLYVGRTCGEWVDVGWGNPYRVGEFGDARACVDAYRAHLRGNPDLLARRAELVGKRLACHCTPCDVGECHGFVLVELANTGKVRSKSCLKRAS